MSVPLKKTCFIVRFKFLYSKLGKTFCGLLVPTPPPATITITLTASKTLYGKGAAIAVVNGSPWELNYVAAPNTFY